MKRSIVLCLGVAGLGIVVAACHSKPKMPVGVNTVSDGGSMAPSTARKIDKGPPGVIAHLVATVSEKSIGPFWARRGPVAMAAYVGASPEGARRVVSVPLTPNADVRGDPHVVSTAQAEASTLVVRATGGTGAGFVAAWTALTDRGEALSIVGIADDGSPRGTVIELAHSVDDVVWMDIVPTARGAVCVWAEETRGGDANILAVALDPDGKMRGVPSRVARGAKGWQVAPTSTGVGLALVMAPDNAALSASGRPTAVAGRDSGRGATSGTGATGGTLAWLRLDPEAHPIGALIPVTTKSSVSGDVDVVRIGEHSLLAWTDRSASDPQIATCMISDAGKIEAVRRPLESTSGSVLVGVAAGAAGGVLAWEEPSKRDRSARQVHLAHVTSAGTLDTKMTTLEIQGRGAPEIVATDTGFGVLANARACETPATSSCADAAVIPTFIRLDAQLGIVQTEPLFLGDDREEAAMAWGLACVTEQCFVLTAAGDPARVRAVDLASRPSRYAAPVVSSPPLDAPKLITVATIASGEPFADIAVAKIADTTLVATVTAAIENGTTTRGRAPAAAAAEQASATLTIRALDAKGTASASPSILSTRALSVGGVAIAAGGTPEDGAAVVWVAREGGDPQVHVTRVDKRGKRMNDVQLTTAKGEAADVAVAWADGGWVVAWVDWRAGNGEVFATKVGTDLGRVAREERITDAPGDASDVALLANPRGDAVWLAWADPRESPKDGFADTYVTQLKAHDCKRSIDEERVLASAAHSRSPSLAPSGDGVVVAWIEEAPMGADAASSAAYGAMLATLDGRGRLRESPFKLKTPNEGFATAIALDPVASGIRAILARGSREEMTLDTLELGTLPMPHIFPLLTLDGPPSMDVAIAILDGVVYFNDEGPDPSDRRARRAIVQFRH